MIGGLGVGILFSIILASFGAAVTAGLGSLILLALAAITLAITAYYLWSNYTDDQRQCFWQGFDTGAILGGAGASSLVSRVSNALYTFEEAVLVARTQNIGAAIGFWTGIILGRFVPNNTVQGCW